MIMNEHPAWRHILNMGTPQYYLHGYIAQEEDIGGSNMICFTIIIAFVLFQLPPWYDDLQFSATFIAYANSAINPIIYTAFNQRFRSGNKEL